MLPVEETLAAMRREMRPPLETAMEGVLTRARVVLQEVEQRRAEGLANVAEKRATGLAELNAKCAAGLAEVDARREELRREFAAMHKHKQAQEGRVKLNIGGYRFETSVQTLRRVPHTFFDAYFSGRYVQDVCTDGCIFVDRDGAHFGHILEYMRDGIVSIAEPGACPSVSLVRLLKRELGFYSIELCAEQAVDLQLSEMAFVMGGAEDDDDPMASMERYDASSMQWSAAVAMVTSRRKFETCMVDGEVYVIGGDNGEVRMAGVDKYSPLSDTWSAATSLLCGRSNHAAVAMGLDIYVLGGMLAAGNVTAEVLKYDSILDAWTQSAPMPERRYNFASCELGTDIYVFRYGEHPSQTSVFKLNTRSNAWIILAPMPSAYVFHCASVLAGSVYIVGAEPGQDNLRFDVATKEWSALSPNLDSKRGGASFVFGGCLYAAGRPQAMSSVERYDVAGDL
jgi:hypothetical protein